MINDKNEKLMRVIETAPAGLIFTNAWLEQHGISAKLAWWYVRSGLLERVGTKAYKKAGDHITWMGAVAALQKQLHLPLHVGGTTALQLLRRNKDSSIFNEWKIILFTSLGIRMPSWLNDNKWPIDFNIRRTSLFSNRNKTLGLVAKNIEGIILHHSCIERAAMEILFLAPKYITLYDVTELMEKLSPLHPEMVQLLLENCNSIKVKRFFLYYANRFRRGLISKLDLTKINLGSGKRVIGRGGRYRYHPKYKLSLPEKIDEPD